MGVLYEINWYLVASSKKDIVKINDNKYILEKSEKRIYPIDSEIPLIVKNVGCIAIIKINKLIVDKKNTSIEFFIIKEFNIDSEISKHYYEMYINMKNK
ncbi:MAG: DUF2584 family protein [Clostridium perfringens]|nr:DUF2584 family protein [Clostridium perfringens]